ncbi:MAG: hypothetical protein JXR83_13680 [Deltaproteobacteria bacterium]|nr:hypothetical protein [Deltaproteobacteria bacterium]
MMLTALALLTQLAAIQPPTIKAEPTVFDVIDQRFGSGEIDLATRHLWRVAAIKSPQLLPAELQQMVGARATPRAREAMTSVLVEAWQWAGKLPEEGEQVRQLLLPPADLPLTLDSALYPIRVSYRSSTSQAFAQQVLTASEHSWQVETEDYGFAVPTIESGAERYRVRIEPTGMGGGAYTAPYDYDTSSHWTACFSYVVFDDSNPSDYIGSTMAHELNHAMQATMDCAEITTFWENTATYIMSTVYPDAFWETVAYLPYFQQQPWRALDYMDEYHSDAYEYGGVLLPLYLVGAYATSDGPVFMRKVWEACRQSWAAYDNVPHYYDAIAQVVAQRGGPAGMEAIHADFSEARFFVGDNADIYHIPNARRLWGGEPTVTNRYTLRDLPIEQAQPPYGEAPNQYGANFVQLDNLGDRPLRFEFDGESTTRWEVRVVLFGGSEPSLTHTIELDPETWQGGATLDPIGHGSAVLVVANLGSADYDPNRRRWTSTSYSYSIRELPSAPILDRIDPNVAELGASGMVFTLHGAEFVASDRFGVEFLDPRVRVTGFEVLDGEQVRLVVDVDPDAPVGPVAIRVANEPGIETSADGLLEIVDLEAGGEQGALGCGCAGSAAGADLLALALLGLALGWRRRRA